MVYLNYAIFQRRTPMLESSRPKKFSHQNEITTPIKISRNIIETKEAVQDEEILLLLHSVEEKNYALASEVCDGDEKLVLFLQKNSIFKIDKVVLNINVRNFTLRNVTRFFT